MKWEISAIICLIVLAVFSCGCTSMIKEPVITVQDLELVNVTPTDLFLNVSLLVDNPNMFDLPLDSLTCNLSYLNSGSWTPMVRISKQDLQINKGSNTVVIPVHMKNADFIQAGFSLLKEKELTLKIEGTATPSWFGISLPIPFSVTKTIPLNSTV